MASSARRSSNVRKTAVSEAFQTSRRERKASTAPTPRGKRTVPGPSQRQSLELEGSVTVPDQAVSVAIRRHVLSTARAYLKQKQEQRVQDTMGNLAMHSTFLASRRTSKANRFIRNLRENSIEQKLLHLRPQPPRAGSRGPEASVHEGTEAASRASPITIMDEACELAAQLGELSNMKSANQELSSISESISACTDLLSRLHATGLSQALHLDQIAADLQNAQEGYGVSKALLLELQRDIASMRRAMESIKIEPGEVSGIAAPEVRESGLAPVLGSLEEKARRLLDGTGQGPSFDELDEDATRLLVEVERATSQRETQSKPELLEAAQSPPDSPGSPQADQASASEVDGQGSIYEVSLSDLSAELGTAVGDSVSAAEQRGQRPTTTPAFEATEEALPSPSGLDAEETSSGSHVDARGPSPDPSEPLSGWAWESFAHEAEAEAAAESSPSSAASASAPAEADCCGQRTLETRSLGTASTESSPTNSLGRAVQDFWQQFCEESELPSGFLEDASSASCSAEDWWRAARRTPQDSVEAVGKLDPHSHRASSHELPLRHRRKVSAAKEWTLDSLSAAEWELLASCLPGHAGSEDLRKQLLEPVACWPPRAPPNRGPEPPPKAGSRRPTLLQSTAQTITQGPLPDGRRRTLPDILARGRKK